MEAHHHVFGLPSGWWEWMSWALICLIWLLYLVLEQLHQYCWMFGMLCRTLMCTSFSLFFFSISFLSFFLKTHVYIIWLTMCDYRWTGWHAFGWLSAVQIFWYVLGRKYKMQVGMLGTSWMSLLINLLCAFLFLLATYMSLSSVTDMFIIMDDIYHLIQYWSWGERDISK